MSRPYSAALPIAHVVLRILIVLNWAMAAAVLGLLLAASTNAQWIMSAFKLAASPDTTRLIWAMRAIAALGVASAPLNYMLLKRLLAMIGTVRAGDPFVAANAVRLQAIAWILLVLQLLSIVIGAIGKSVSTSAHPVHLDAGFSPSQWLAILLIFVLARVFAEGARMRDDLEGTV